jgi:hypothetical protein
MNDFEDLMQAAWRQEQPRDGGDTLANRVRRHRRRQRRRRGVEVALTLVAIAVLSGPLLGSDATPGYWLVMPFFVAYLPIAWLQLLHTQHPQAIDATQDVRTYAHVRLSQLRTGLRELWFTRIAALGLLAYAILVASGAFVFGELSWHVPALQLLTYASVWTLLTLWLCGRQRHRCLWEYRTIRRLAI